MFSYVLKKCVKNKIFRDEGLTTELWFLHLCSALYFFSKTHSFLLLNSQSFLGGREGSLLLLLCVKKHWWEQPKELAQDWQALVVGEPGIAARGPQRTWGCPVPGPFSGTCLAFARTCLCREYFHLWNENLRSLFIYSCNFYLFSPLTCHLWGPFSPIWKVEWRKERLYMPITTFDWREEFSDASKSIVLPCRHFWKLRAVFYNQSFKHSWYYCGLGH